MADEAIGFKAGRTWSVEANGISTIKRTYIVRREQTDLEVGAFVGVPAIGSEWRPETGLIARHYEVTEGGDSDKDFLQVEVTFSRDEGGLEGVNRVPAGQDIQSWGWRHGSVTRELTHDTATGNILTNSAGQPYESAPQFEVASPVFTKVVKTVQHQSWRGFANKVNAGEVSVNGETFAPHTLRCIQVDEEKLWGDTYGYQWQYTISVQYLSNKVVIEQGDKVEIGWDIAITDAGCYTLENGKLSRISWIDAETKKLVYATSPQLLNGVGGLLTGGGPYNFRQRPYEETTFPDDFFSLNPTRRLPNTGS